MPMPQLTPRTVGIARLRRKLLPRGFVRAVAQRTGYHESYVSNLLRQPHKWNAGLAVYMLGYAKLSLPSRIADPEVVAIHQLGLEGADATHLRQGGKRTRRPATSL